MLIKFMDANYFLLSMKRNKSLKKRTWAGKEIPKEKDRNGDKYARPRIRRPCQLEPVTPGWELFSNFQVLLFV